MRPAGPSRREGRAGVTAPERAIWRVPPFRNDPEEWGRTDWSLLQNGFVHLYWHSDVLATAVESLSADGYRCASLDAIGWESEQDALVAIGRAFDFPDYYGRNANAFKDCLSDVAMYEYGADAKSSGTVLVLAHFDRYAARQGARANVILDIFANCARLGMLVGHRMLCLVQSDDPDIRFDPVGANPVLWNPAEFLDSKRHV
jgi:hypothetical protein